MKLNTRPRVLCVDDNEDFREMLSALLKFSLIEASGVATAAQALRLTQAERFDLYLLDSFLPDVDGFELCRQMRAANLHIPILFFSGAAYVTDKQKGIQAGANAYVVKPDVDELLENIAKFIAPAVCVGKQATSPWSSSERPLALRAESAERQIELRSWALPVGLGATH